jgi:AcrR family transcriptional regulator
VSGPARNSIYPELAAIPHGPHRLTRDEVTASQLARLRAAVVALVADQGYAAVTITAIARHARVSPNVFYQHFADKQACFLDAYGTFATVVVERVAHATGDTVAELVISVLTEYLGLLDREPDAARAFMLEIDGVGVLGRARRRDFYRTAAAGLAARREELQPSGSTPSQIPVVVYVGLVQGVHGIATDALDTQPAGQLIDLVPELAAWITPTIDTPSLPT